MHVQFWFSLILWWTQQTFLIKTHSINIYNNTWLYCFLSNNNIHIIIVFFISDFVTVGVGFIGMCFILDSTIFYASLASDFNTFYITLSAIPISLATTNMGSYNPQYFYYPVSIRDRQRRQTETATGIRPFFLNKWLQSVIPTIRNVNGFLSRIS